MKRVYRPKPPIETVAALHELIAQDARANGTGANIRIQTTMNGRIRQVTMDGGNVNVQTPSGPNVRDQHNF